MKQSKARLLIESLKKKKKLGETVYWQLVVKNHLLSLIKQLKREEADENAVKIMQKLDNLVVEVDELYQKLADTKESEKGDEKD